MKTGIFAALVMMIAANAQAMECKGKDLSFQIENRKISKIVTSEKQVVAGIKTASNAGFDLTPLTNDKDGYTTMLEGEFQSPSPMGSGQVQIVMDEKTGKAALSWDNGDGGMLSFDLICK